MSYAPVQKPATARSSSIDMANRRIPIIHRHQTSGSTGGGRAWSDAEEAYLIETREHKMPYKHIAAQLKKTELACRLHYHQLSYGNKSRRQPSISSTHSYERVSMTPPSQPRQPTPQRPLPSYSPPATPENVEYAACEASYNSLNHKAILPKPISSPQRVLQEMRSLRLITDDMDKYHQQEYVDITRLDRIYNAHRLHFWSTIARSYGGNLSPTTLEDLWRQAHAISGSNLPPTPSGSPQTAQAAPSIPSTPYSAVAENCKGFTPINPNEVSVPKPSSRHNGFAISSLLTENKEVRSPSRERKLQDVEMQLR